MRYTVVFDTKLEQGSSYSLTYEPCPIWSKGDDWVINLNPESPYLQSGSLLRLIREERIDDIQAVAILVHSAGNGAEGDLELLLDDVKELKLPYQVVRF